MQSPGGFTPGRDLNFFYTGRKRGRVAIQASAFAVRGPAWPRKWRRDGGGLSRWLLLLADADTFYKVLEGS